MCPHCKQPMIAIELDGIEIDHCLECRGTWLDSGELEAITERAGVGRDQLSEAIRAAPQGRRGSRRCPRCRRRLVTVNLAEPSGLELDRCRLGHGLWFDQGEMISLISAFSEGGDEAVSRFFADLYHSELDAQAKG